MKVWKIWAWNMKMCPSEEQKVTGWDNGLSQDYNSKLGQWFANRPGALQQLRETMANNAMQPQTKNIYPALNTVAEVFTMAESKIPVIHRNEMHSILMTMQNTLLKQIKEK